MSGLKDIICDYILIFAVLSALCFVFVGAYYKSETKSALYSECLETEYNKFECYSMIYGDK